MLITINIQLRRHRRKIAWSIALLALLIIAVVAWFAIVDQSQGHKHGSSTAAVCITLGACLAATGVAVVAVRRLRGRVIFANFELPPYLAVAIAPSAFTARDGPGPLLQVFRN